MVLSNRKLKLKLRAQLSQNQNDYEVVAHDAPSSSLKTLLDSASHKPVLSKREKRRKLRSLQPPPAAEAGDGVEGAKKESGSEGLSKKGTKKRKRKVDEGDLENGVPEDAEKSKNTHKKKQKQKKKNAKTVEENGSNHGGEVPEAEGLNKTSTTTSQENGDVENGVPKDAEKSKNKTKKKKKKKKKQKKKKAKTVEANSSNHGGEVPETAGLKTTTTTSQENGDVQMYPKKSQENGDVPTKVYVGGIPYYSTEDDIRSYFESCGTITEVDCMYFPESGKFRGIAIISFKTEAAAKRALALDGADMGGLFLKIQPYKATRASKASSDFAPEILDGYNRIYVGNLSWDITEEELRKFFSNCNITSLRFGMDKDTGEFRGYAHVDFSDSQSLKTALTLDQKVLSGRPVKISCAVPLKKKPGSNTSSVARNKGIDGKKSSSAAATNDGVDGEKSSSAAATNNGVDGEKSSSTVSGKIRRRTCYECGEKGHLLSECPKKQTVPSTST